MGNSSHTDFKAFRVPQIERRSNVIWTNIVIYRSPHILAKFRPAKKTGDNRGSSRPENINIVSFIQELTVEELAENQTFEQGYIVVHT